MNLEKQDVQWIEETITKINNKMEWVSERSKEKIPYTTVNGVYDNCINTDINWWTNGFWAGMMWLMFHETKKERYAKIARFSEEKLDQCLNDYYGLHHDVGFMWLHTAVADYRLTGEEEGKRRGLHAANLLAGRFNPVGRFIRAWNNQKGSEDDNTGWAIIDCMMNIPLLYWASEEIKDPRFSQIAMMHADTVMKNFIREDGSVRHIVEFDPVHGGMVREHGGQGYQKGSSWTRGQAWGLYGFTISYIHTKKEEYLDAAKRIAHYFMENIPETGWIPIDFCQPQKPALEDSTAAAIAACGLIEIARNVSALEAKTYEQAALKLLKALESHRCAWGKETDGILQKCSASYGEKEHEYHIIYGDYFFMEAMFKLKGNDCFLW